MAHVQIFISAVSAEFEAYREALRRDLDRPAVSVKIQENFIATGSETLDKLDDYIRSCHVVLHMIGSMSGAFAQEPSIELLRERYPEMPSRFPQLAQALSSSNPTRLSYTQWEAWLALYHRKPLIIARASDEAERGPRYLVTEEQLASQATHLKNLAAQERYPEIIFENADRLVVGMLRSRLHDILATAGTISLASVLRAKLGEKAIEAITSGNLDQAVNLPRVQERLEDAIASHLTKIANWSGNIQFYRMPAPKQTDDSTISLSFSSIPRKFQSSKANRASKQSEDGFLSTPSNYVILGQPGAGKTTTIKRLVRKLLNPSTADSLSRAWTPLVVRLNIFNRDNEQNNRRRDFGEQLPQGAWLSQSQTNPLLAALATELGLRHSLVAPDEMRRRGIRDSYEDSGNLVRICEGVPIRLLLPRVLDGLHAAVFLDGLDEVNASLRGAIENDIAFLIEATKNCKYIVTCRSAEYANAFAYLTVAEVCDLEAEEIESLSQRWLGPDSSAFLTKLNGLPLAELARRPLFLMQMLVLYANNGYLPDQPFEIYRLITILMIREWDKDRNIQRMSKYADFESERKLDFLANLAFDLTYVTGTKVFTDYELGKSYSRIRKKFGLPEDQQRQVLTEIESHTGIVAETGGDRFEFAHLTIQEYLCAYHLVRLPFPKRSISKYLKQYPAPLAIATALSSEPVGWLAGILCDPEVSRDVEPQKLVTFLDRLAIENPVLTTGPAIGFCLVGLLFAHAQLRDAAGQEAVAARIDALVAKPFIRLSLVDALTCYSTDRLDIRATPGQLALRISENAPMELLEAMESPPTEGSVDSSWLRTRFGNDLLLDGLRIARRR